ncbi:MAG TPA: CBS domain-containing protein [Sedimentisphaerales bacterium]|nr:CBS domain-containing protein [Sedimentisphaerales bacterium]
MGIPRKLEEMSKRVQCGEQATATVRELLSWFGAYRRGWWNVKAIRKGLDEAGLITSPDFEGEYIDASVIFQVKQSVDTVSATVGDEVSIRDHVTVHLVPGQGPAERPEPAHRISRLASANTPPLFVKPDATVAEAITLMLRHDYSQLPVMQSSRELKGLFSWKSLGSRLAMGKSSTRVADFMETAKEMSSDGSLFDAVQIIAEHDCVLVRAGDRTICGIVTGYDISKQFRQLAEPFLLLADIESHIRYLISKAFTLPQLQQAKDPDDQDRSITDVRDMTFGEYVRLLQNEDNWARLNMKIDRKTFTGWLEKIRDIRNDVMHFDPDPMDPADLKLLRDITGLLDRCQRLTP